MGLASNHDHMIMPHGLVKEYKGPIVAALVLNRCVCVTLAGATRALRAAHGAEASPILGAKDGVPIDV